MPYLAWAGKSKTLSVTISSLSGGASGYIIKSFLTFCSITGGEQRNNQYKEEFVICFPDSMCSVILNRIQQRPLAHGTTGHRGDEDITQGLSSALYFSNITSVVF